MKKVEILSRKRLFNDFLKIDEGHVSYQQYDGTMSGPVRRLVLERGDAVAALVYHSDWNEYLLVEQFRFPTHGQGPGWLTEIVAGVLEVGEEPEECVRRELEEEIGYRPAQLEHLSTFYVSPGGSSERVFLYYARVSEADKVGEGGGLLEEHEDIALVRYTPQALQAALHDGSLQDAKTLLAIALSAKYLPTAGE